MPELVITPEEAQFLAELKGSGQGNIMQAIAAQVQSRARIRDARAKGEADEDAEEAVEINRALKRQMNRIVTRYLGKAEGEQFAREVNHVELALEADEVILGASSAYSDIETSKQCTDEQYKAYIGCGILLHAPTTYANLLHSVTTQLIAKGKLEVNSGGKLKFTTFLAQYLLGAAPQISNADFDTNPLLNGGPMQPLLKQILSMGPQFHEVNALGVVKKSENFSFKFLKNGLSAPAESVAAVNGTFLWVVMRGYRQSIAN